MKTTILGALAALIIGVAAGFFAGKNAASSTESTDSQAAEVRSARRSNVGSSTSGRYAPGRSTRVKSTEEAMRLPGQNARLQALMDYYAELSPSQFEDEAKKLEDLPWSERILMGYFLFARWGEEDPTAAMAYTKTMGFAGMFVRSTVMRSWAAKYPQDAAKYYTDNPNEFRMSGMMRGRHGGRGSTTAGIIAAEWARQDSAGAMAWAQSLEGRDRRDAVRSIFSQAAKDDPAKAAGMLSGITDEEARKSAQNTIAREWGKQDWDAAQAWINGLPADQRAEATSRALRGFADKDPESAAGKLASIPEGEARDDIMENIAKKWGRENPAAAADWVMKNGSEEAQRMSIGRVVSSWVRQDAAAALEFVNKQPEGAVRDKAVSSYVMANQGGDTQQNLKLAETITDKKARARAIGITAIGWMREDKEAATNYLQTTEALDDNSKEWVMRWAQRRGGR